MVIKKNIGMLFILNYYNISYKNKKVGREWGSAKKNIVLEKIINFISFDSRSKVTISKKGMPLVETNIIYHCTPADHIPCASEGASCNGAFFCNFPLSGASGERCEAGEQDDLPLLVRLGCMLDSWHSESL